MTTQLLSLVLGLLAFLCLSSPSAAISSLRHDVLLKQQADDVSNEFDVEAFLEGDSLVDTEDLWLSQATLFPFPFLGLPLNLRTSCSCTGLAFTTCDDIDIDQITAETFQLNDNNKGFMGVFQRSSTQNCRSLGYYFDNEICDDNQMPCGHFVPGCHASFDTSLVRHCANPSNGDFFSSGISRRMKRPESTHFCNVRHRFSFVELDSVIAAFENRTVALLLPQVTDESLGATHPNNTCLLGFRVNVSPRIRGCMPYPHCQCWARVWDKCCQDEVNTTCPYPRPPRDEVTTQGPTDAPVTSAPSTCQCADACAEAGGVVVEDDDLGTACQVDVNTPCPPGYPCLILCTDEATCNNRRLNCNNGFDCKLYCNGTNSCERTQLNCGDPACDDQSCASELSCSLNTNVTCNVECQGSCNGLVVDSRYVQNSVVTVEGQRDGLPVAQGSCLWCPRENGNCTFNCISQLGDVGVCEDLLLNCGNGVSTCELNCLDLASNPGGVDTCLRAMDVFPYLAEQQSQAKDALVQVDTLPTMDAGRRVLFNCIGNPTTGVCQDINVLCGDDECTVNCRGNSSCLRARVEGADVNLDSITVRCLSGDEVCRSMYITGPDANEYPTIFVCAHPADARQFEYSCLDVLIENRYADLEVNCFAQTRGKNFCNNIRASTLKGDFQALCGADGTFSSTGVCRNAQFDCADESCDVVCRGRNACDSMNVEGGDSDDTSVICVFREACRDSNIECPDDKFDNCTLGCFAVRRNADQTCFNANLNCNNSRCDARCSGGTIAPITNPGQIPERVCGKLTVHASPEANTIVSCARGRNTCKKLDIQSEENGDNVILACRGQGNLPGSVCEEATVECGEENCIVDCRGDTCEEIKVDGDNLGRGKRLIMRCFGRACNKARYDVSDNRLLRFASIRCVENSCKNAKFDANRDLISVDCASEDSSNTCDNVIVKGGRTSVDCKQIVGTATGGICQNMALSGRRRVQLDCEGDKTGSTQNSGVCASSRLTSFGFLDLNCKGDGAFTCADVVLKNEGLESKTEVDCNARNMAESMCSGLKVRDHGTKQKVDIKCKAHQNAMNTCENFEVTGTMTGNDADLRDFDLKCKGGENTCKGGKVRLTKAPPVRRFSADIECDSESGQFACNNLMVDINNFKRVGVECKDDSACIDMVLQSNSDENTLICDGEDACMRADLNMERSRTLDVQCFGGDEACVQLNIDADEMLGDLNVQCTNDGDNTCGSMVVACPETSGECDIQCSGAARTDKSGVCNGMGVTTGEEKATINCAGGDPSVETVCAGMSVSGDTRELELNCVNGEKVCSAMCVELDTGLPLATHGSNTYPASITCDAGSTKACQQAKISLIDYTSVDLNCDHYRSCQNAEMKIQATYANLDCDLQGCRFASIDFLASVDAAVECNSTSRNNCQELAINGNQMTGSLDVLCEGRDSDVCIAMSVICSNGGGTCTIGCAAINDEPGLCQALTVVTMSGSSTNIQCEVNDDTFVHPICEHIQVNGNTSDFDMKCISTSNGTCGQFIIDIDADSAVNGEFNLLCDGKETGRYTCYEGNVRAKNFEKSSIQGKSSLQLAESDTRYTFWRADFEFGGGQVEASFEGTKTAHQAQFDLANSTAASIDCLGTAEANAMCQGMKVDGDSMAGDLSITCNNEDSSRGACNNMDVKCPDSPHSCDTSCVAAASTVRNTCVRLDVFCTDGPCDVTCDDTNGPTNNNRLSCKQVEVDCPATNTGTCKFEYINPNAFDFRANEAPEMNCNSLMNTVCMCTPQQVLEDGSNVDVCINQS